MKRVILFLILITSLMVKGQIVSDTIDINVSGRVDTSNIDVLNIYQLFKTYLQTRPDSIRVNSCWSKVEQDKGYKGNIALFYTPFYNLGADPKTIFSIWKPFVLSIEQEHKTKYKIRVALIKQNNDPDKLLTILNLNAVYENDKWVLQNTINDFIESWNKKSYKYLNYYFPPGYSFNVTLAAKSIHFCDSIAKELRINKVDTFSYFICSNPDQMGQLFGYDFFYLNYTSGLTIKWRNEIYSAQHAEFYPHEFMHMLFKTINNDSINYIVEEGLASFLGEFGTDKYRNQILLLAKDYLAKLPSYTLDNLLNNSASWNGYQTAYPTGSILAEIVYENAGFNGIRSLIVSSTINDKLIYDVICKITKMNKQQLEKEFRKKLYTYDLKYKK